MKRSIKSLSTKRPVPMAFPLTGCRPHCKWCCSNMLSTRRQALSSKMAVTLSRPKRKFTLDFVKTWAREKSMSISSQSIREAQPIYRWVIWFFFPSKRNLKMIFFFKCRWIKVGWQLSFEHFLYFFLEKERGERTSWALGKRERGFLYLVIGLRQVISVPNWSVISRLVPRYRCH